MPSVAAATASPPVIHPTAMVAAGARIADGCHIGPFCMVGPDAVLEAGVDLVSHVIIEGHSHLAAGVKVMPFATIGLVPQDLKYKGEPTRVTIGARTVIREHATVHRGSVSGAGVTVVGADCMLMVGAHIAHDCVLGDRVLLANNVLLAGHVEIGDMVFVGGGAAVHQFVRIGQQSVIGGLSGVEADVIPYGAVMGNRARMIGLNQIGLKRRGMTHAQRHALRSAFRMMFLGNGSVEERRAAAEAQYPDNPAVAEILAFIRAPSKRGIVKVGRQVSFEDDDAPDA
ncbi:acyl-ACP--UDP-N-acetylglucosamine O-acyltransferase [Humitalea sp. 24SJ18S-53]|uniref:acyl-ACP--UDP-N-acetylglucosamine O-acyltransferase n=1 Tax=Humitalea sp. 24SJ18S-53 TaxID=3422307 RepID=UPI003D678968